MESSTTGKTLKEQHSYVAPLMLFVMIGYPFTLPPLSPSRILIVQSLQESIRGATYLEQHFVERCKDMAEIRLEYQNVDDDVSHEIDDTTTLSEQGVRVSLFFAYPFPLPLPHRITTWLA